MVSQEHRPPHAESAGDGRPLLGGHDQVGRLVEASNPVGEEDGVVRQQLEVGVRGRERGRVRGMAVDDRADVRAGSVHLGVEDRLEMKVGRAVTELDDVLRLDLVERDALALDEDRVTLARAHMAERQVGVALESEDPAGPGHLLLDEGRAPDHRRSVGG
jgi:hypothetical protein